MVRITTAVEVCFLLEVERETILADTGVSIWVAPRLAFVHHVSQYEGPELTVICWQLAADEGVDVGGRGWSVCVADNDVSVW